MNDAMSIYWLYVLVSVLDLCLMPLLCCVYALGSYLWCFSWMCGAVNCRLSCEPGFTLICSLLFNILCSKTKEPPSPPLIAILNTSNFINHNKVNFNKHATQATNNQTSGHQS